MNQSRLLMSLGLCTALVACSTAQVANEEASELIEQGQYEAGLARVEEGLRENPRDTELHLLLNSGRAKAITALLTQGDTDRARRDFASARMASSNRSLRSRPRALARYIAASASRSRSSPTV